MSTLGILIIAIILAIDAFTVSICIGVCPTNNKNKLALKSSFMFGFFQFLMPVVGFFLGSQIKQYIGIYDHWIAFLLLLGVGLKFIYEAVKKIVKIIIKYGFY
jgi:putative Mn2+ efflux pump MntP